MKSNVLIRILATENNRRGDLFGRLMSDLFVALGYDAPRLNVHKTGRELDLTCSHRLEKRRAVAECKATDHPIGGADINKFVGALDAEHDDPDRAVTVTTESCGRVEIAWHRPDGSLKQRPYWLCEAEEHFG